MQFYGASRGTEKLSELLRCAVAVVLLLPRSDRPTQRQSGHNGERVAPAAPKNSPLMGPLYPSHDSRDKSRLDGCEQTTDAGTRESERYK